MSTKGKPNDHSGDQRRPRRAQPGAAGAALWLPRSRLLGPGWQRWSGTAQRAPAFTDPVAALRNSGMVAPMVLDRPDQLRGLPNLRRSGTRSRVALRLHCLEDHLGSHKGAGVRTAAGIWAPACFSLPACIPEFNPIENGLTQMTAMLRKAAARTVEGLWNTIGSIVDTFTPDECANYFAATE
jgi:hypothetical protein